MTWTTRLAAEARAAGTLLRHIAMTLAAIALVVWCVSDSYIRIGESGQRQHWLGQCAALSEYLETQSGQAHPLDCYLLLETGKTNVEVKVEPMPAAAKPAKPVYGV